jgi:hypothetical protein
MKRSQFWLRVCIVMGAFLLFSSVILMITLLALCVQSVNQTEYAVGYDTYNMEFTKIYTQVTIIYQ